MLLYLLGAALFGGIGIDWLLGDPPNKYHPVAWLGQLIGFFLPRLKGGSEKAKGTIFAISLVIIIALAVHFLIFASRYLAGLIELVVVSAIIFKITIAMKGMERHTKAIVNCLEACDLEATRHNLATHPFGNHRMHKRKHSRRYYGTHLLLFTFWSCRRFCLQGNKHTRFYGWLP
jgi:adenosylcobinamide-phosphate synthase